MRVGAAEVIMLIYPRTVTFGGGSKEGVFEW